jgi:hypothetical protein
MSVAWGKFEMRPDERQYKARCCRVLHDKEWEFSEGRVHVNHVSSILLLAPRTVPLPEMNQAQSTHCMFSAKMAFVLPTPAEPEVWTNTFLTPEFQKVAFLNKMPLTSQNFRAQLLLFPSM